MYTLPFTTFAFFLGVCSTLPLTAIPNQMQTYLILFACLLSIHLQDRKFISFIFIVALGFAFMGFHVNQHLAHSLPIPYEGQKLKIKGTISSVVEENEIHRAKFVFKVTKLYDQSSTWQLPAYVHLSWNKAKHKLQPGDILSLNIKLKRPRNYANPGSFDSEKYFFQQRIVAVGYVVEGSDNKVLKHNFFLSPLNLVRQYLNSAINRALAGQEFKSIISSLVLGLRGDLSTQHTAVLQATGTAHLLAISGLHIGILSGICFVILRYLWRYLPRRWLQMPAPSVSAGVSLIICILYAGLAGFSIATQRSIIMLAVFLAGILLRRKMSTLHSYSLALLLVLLWDPFAVLAPGFWFSFIAVGFLLYALRHKSVPKTKLSKIVAWLKPQIVIFIALLPITLFYFGKSSLIAPVANMIAIPWVSFLVLPLSLCATIFMPFTTQFSATLLQLAERSFAYLWIVLDHLTKIPTLNFAAADQNVVLIMLGATLGAIIILLPAGSPRKWLGILGLLPLFFLSPNIIPHGQADFILLDVGQGLATVIRTQKHILVYDTGPRLREDLDLGARVVVPYLQQLGIDKIDRLVISHIDNDHIGGAKSLLEKIKVNSILISDERGLPNHTAATCSAGQTWEWDGVRFTMLHPDPAVINKKRNDQSCVLMVEAGDHKILLTGDIEKRTEKQLIDHYGSNLRADILLVPHHGSKSSSSLEFIRAVQPKYALIPAGYKNQYGHPKPEILQRYEQLGVEVLRTEYEGAISLRLGGDLLPSSYRKDQQHFYSWAY
jgi:competence protein ComEC